MRSVVREKSVEWFCRGCHSCTRGPGLRRPSIAHRFNVSIKDKLADAESGGAARCSRSLTGLRSPDSGRTLGCAYRKPNPLVRPGESVDARGQWAISTS
jgi:hypothetical protein